MPKICLLCGESFSDSATFCPRDGAALRAAVVGDQLIGEVFCERYVVTDLLGEGGMGAVYRARDVRLPQEVAIKVLRQRATLDQSAITRFRQEAEAASRINHDRVARVSDFGFREDGSAFLVMEFVSGRTLLSYLQAKGVLSLPEAARITLMVAEGLDAAHRLGIIHRDLKPENVMIVEDASGEVRVKVLDFGIAKLLDAKPGSEPTAAEMVIGTPRWMSPEQVLGRPLDGRSDVYALALLTVFMLTAQRPFSGDTDQTEMLARLSSPPQTLAALAPALEFPPDVQQLFDRTLSRDVARRPEGALAFARELNRIAEAHAVSDVPATTAPWFRRTSVVATGALVSTVVLVGVIGAMSYLNTSRNSGSGGPRDSADATQITQPDTSVSSTAVVPDSQPRDSSGSSNGTGGRVSDTAAGKDKPKPEVKKVVVDSAPNRPDRGTIAREQLRQLQDLADSLLGGASPRTHAPSLIDQFTALLPRLTRQDDQAWVQFYLGSSYAALADNQKACAALAKARALGGATSGVGTSAEQMQEHLRCPSP